MTIIVVILIAMKIITVYKKNPVHHFQLIRKKYADECTNQEKSFIVSFGWSVLAEEHIVLLLEYVQVLLSLSNILAYMAQKERNELQYLLFFIAISLPMQIFLDLITVILRNCLSSLLGFFSLLAAKATNMGSLHFQAGH